MSSSGLHLRQRPGGCAYAGSLMSVFSGDDTTLFDRPRPGVPRTTKINPNALHQNTTLLVSCHDLRSRTLYLESPLSETTYSYIWLTCAQCTQCTIEPTYRTYCLMEFLHELGTLLKPRVMLSTPHNIPFILGCDGFVDTHFKGVFQDKCVCGGLGLRIGPLRGVEATSVGSPGLTCSAYKLDVFLLKRPRGRVAEASSPFITRPQCISSARRDRACRKWLTGEFSLISII
ncbi:hypothetical protein J6590_087407 [Homalodisca vitripennis]|nr:hypothetical protein J6590_087407 [Homalodisca vitripennis]